MFPVFVIMFIALNILLAKSDARKIEYNEWIDHRFNALFYIGCILLTIPIAFSVGDLTNRFYTYLVIALLLVRKITFDIALNIYRGKKWWWISLTTSSKIDQFENRIFGYNGKIKYMFYIILLISVISLFFIF